MSKAETYWSNIKQEQGRRMSTMMDMLNSTLNNPVLSHEVNEVVSSLMVTKKSLNNKQKILATTPATKNLVSALTQLREVFNIQDIAKFLRYQDTKSTTNGKSHQKVKKSETLFSVKGVVESALDYWKSSSLETLSYDEVFRQFMNWNFVEMKPTDLQYGILSLLKSAEPFAKVIVAPTGAGKTFGIGAIMGICQNRCVVYSPMNKQAMQQIIGATTSAGVPVCFVTRNVATGEFEYKGIFETMGKGAGNSIQEMSDNILKTRDVKKRTHYKTHIPRLIVCHPSLRKEGLDEVWQDIYNFCNDLIPALIVDDFCASSQDIKSSLAVHTLLTNVDRLILLTATPPTEMNAVNSYRIRNSLGPITYDTYSKTLGMGVRLVTNEGKYVSLLDNMDVFDNSPFALSTLPPQYVFQLLKDIHGEQGARNLILDNMPNITLDDIREQLIQTIRDKGGDYNKACILPVTTDTTHYGKCLVLDEDPLDRLNNEVPLPEGYLTYTHQENGKVSNWVDLLKRELNNYIGIIKNQLIVKDKSAKSKHRNDGENSKELERFEETITEQFQFPRLLSCFRSMPYELLEMLELCKENNIPDEEICYVLQKQVLVVTKQTPNSWIGLVLQHVHTIYADESMSAGVNIDRLNKVYLPRQMVSASGLIQGMGRVGRPHQGAGIVIGSQEQFDAMFSKDVGDISAKILSESPVFRSKDIMTVVDWTLDPVTSPIGMISGNWADDWIQSSNPSLLDIMKEEHVAEMIFEQDIDMKKSEIIDQVVDEASLLLTETIIEQDNDMKESQIIDQVVDEASLLLAETIRENWDDGDDEDSTTKSQEGKKEECRSVEALERRKKEKKKRQREAKKAKKNST